MGEKPVNLLIIICEISKLWIPYVNNCSVSLQCIKKKSAAITFKRIL